MPSYRNRAVVAPVLVLVLLGPVAAAGQGRDVAGATEREVENLATFARLYGYLRFFHPSDEASEIDWDRYAVHGARRVVGARDATELTERLEALIRPIAPTVQIYRRGDPPPVPSSVLSRPDAEELPLVAWQHRGVGLGMRGIYESARLGRANVVPSSSRFGTIVQSIPAGPYRGTRIRLQAAVRTEVDGSGNQAQLWLRVDRPEGATGFFDNMADRPVTSPEWAAYSIEGMVAEDAESIVLGGFLLGHGRAWFDDFRLLVRRGDEAEWEAVPLTNATFDTGELGRPPAGWSASSPNYQYVVTDLDAHRGQRSILISAQPTVSTEPLFDSRPRAGEVVERSLGHELAVQLPLALHSYSGRTIRPADAPAPDELYEALRAIPPQALSPADPAVRFAAVIVAWSVFQHFYPYFDVVAVDWEGVLGEALGRASRDRSDADLLVTLRWLVAQLEDGHGNVEHALSRTRAAPPILFGEVEGGVGVLAVGGSALEDACVRVGDVLQSIDGTPAATVMENAMALISGSPQWRASRAVREFGVGERDSRAVLVLERGSGDRVQCEVVRDATAPVSETRPEPIAPLREGVFYVDLSRAEMADIVRMAPTLAPARGVVFDLRGYPRGNHDVLRYLTDIPLESAQWLVPLQTHPDRVGLEFDTRGRWLLEPRSPRFEGRIVFLTDARAISYAESVMGIVEHYRLGEIVGQPTAGANGNVNAFVVPGGYRITWTGMRVVKHDGGQHHLVGILPTVPVERTLAGVREGRDEVLERGLELILSGRSGRADLAPRR